MNPIAEQAARIGEREQRGSDRADVDHLDECQWCRAECYGSTTICETDGCSECGGPVDELPAAPRIGTNVGDVCVAQWRPRRAA